MKKNFFAMAIIAVAALFSASCGADENFSDNRIEPTPTPTPTPKDTTTKVDPYAWADIMARGLNVDEDRQVESKIIAQRNNGEKDSTILRYVLGFEMAVPDTIRLTQPGTEMTAYTGTLSFPVKDYTPTTVANCDSAIVVTTTKGYKTNYYDVTWKTSHVDGWILFKGKWEPYKNSEETTTFTQPSLYKDAYEIVRNDSIYLREEVKHEVKMSFLKRTFSFEKKVVVDHFLKMKEGEKKEEKINADEWINGLGRLVSLTKGLREDSRLWCDVALLEGGDGYTMIIDTYNTDGGFVGREVKFVSFEVCPKSNDYDGVAWINGAFYPGKITYDASSRGWVVVSYVSGNVKDQSVDARDADARGIKNFKNDNTAYPWPYMINSSTSREVNGKQVITIMGKTSTRSYRGCVVADSLLKK